MDEYLRWPTKYKYTNTQQSHPVIISILTDGGKYTNTNTQIHKYTQSYHVIIASLTDGGKESNNGLAKSVEEDIR